MNKDRLGQRIRYRFPEDETIDQLENVFITDLEIYNNQDFAEVYAAGLFDVTRLRGRWDRELLDQETETEREKFLFLMNHVGIPL